MARASNVLPEPLSANVRAIATALKAHGGCVVTIAYEGYGDSGDIEDVSFDAAADSGLAEVMVTVTETHARWGSLITGPVVGPTELSFREACEVVANELVSFGGYDGYETDAGGGGAITITANGAVTLNHYNRVETTEHEPELCYLA